MNQQAGVQDAPAEAPTSTHGDNAYFQAMASSQESILSLGICHELLCFGKIIWLFSQRTYDCLCTMSTSVQQELAGEL